MDALCHMCNLLIDTALNERHCLMCLDMPQTLYAVFNVCQCCNVL